MITLASILGVVSGIAHYAWMLVLLLIPQVLDFIKPLFSAVVDGIRSYVSSIWEGANNATWATWCLVSFVAGIVGVIGYRYGWNAAIDWGHEHYRWIAKKAVSTSWWNFKHWKFW